MASDTSLADEKIRTMRGDLKKARMGSRTAPIVRRRDGQGKKRLAEIIDRAEVGEGSVLRSLRATPLRPSSSEASQKPPTLKPPITKPPGNLDELLPIEEGGVSKNIIDLEKNRQGSPPPNLPGIKAPSPPKEPPPKPVPQPKAIPPAPIKKQERPTAEGLEEDEKPQETPEELLDFSTPSSVPPKDVVKSPPPKDLVPPSSEPSKPASRQGGRKFVIALVALVAVGSVTGFLIWNFLIAGEEEPLIVTPPAEEQVVEAPNPLVPADFETIIQSAEEMRALEFSSGSPETVVYAPYYLEDEKKFANPEELFAVLDMQAPSPLFRLLDDAVTPYVYIPGDEERERCGGEGIADSSCFSPRLGVVLHATLANVTLIRGVMEDWERTMAQDLRPMVFGNPSLPPSEFSSATYRGIPVRFINLPISTTAINYALTDSFIVIATSKNSLYNVLDGIIEITGGTN